MDNTKDKAINFLYAQLDCIEEILNISMGSKLVDEQGNTYVVTYDKAEKCYCIIMNDEFMVAQIERLEPWIVSMLRDNFLGIDAWEVVK